jgi:predicted dehydrogenase
MNADRRTLRAAVIGAGSLGRYHVQKYASCDGAQLVGIADLQLDRAEAQAKEHGGRAVRDFRELLPHIDVASVVVPTEYHFEVACACIEAGVHVLIEKPMSRTLEEADALIAAAEARKVVLAVGHLERFNPAFLELDALVDRPFFVEAERLGGFKGRGTDVDVVLDLMIHDIDLVLALMPAKVESISACGFQVLTDHIDIANARIEFADGAVADLSASRVSRTPVRKLRVFGSNFYASADLNVPELRVERKPAPGGGASEARVFERADALRTEIEGFIGRVRSGNSRIVSGFEARQALDVALQVNDAIVQRIERFSKTSLAADELR